MALTPRSVFALEQHDAYEGVAEVLSTLDNARIRQLQERFAKATAHNFVAGIASGPYLNCSDFVAAFDYVLPSVESQQAMLAEQDRVEAALSRSATKVGGRRRRDGGVLASYPRRVAALAALFELCDSTGSGMVELRDVLQHVGDRVSRRGGNECNARSRGGRRRDHRRLSPCTPQALSHPRVGPGEQRGARDGGGGGGTGGGDSEITPYNLHQVVTTLAPDSPEVQRAATLAAATSTPGRLAADSMASSLRHQVRGGRGRGAAASPRTRWRAA